MSLESQNSCINIMSSARSSNQKGLAYLWTRTGMQYHRTFSTKFENGVNIFKRPSDIILQISSVSQWVVFPLMTSITDGCCGCVFKGENQVANWLSVCKWNVPTNHRSIQEMLNKSHDKQDHTLFHIVNFPSLGWLVVILRLVPNGNRDT